MRSRIRRTLVAATLPLVGACAGTVESGADNVSAVPEAVIALAAPYQDISTARLLPEDGCYWYAHAGPVESTLLPLRTSEGRPICAAPRKTEGG
jgi:hypothetical protein